MDHAYSAGNARPLGANPRPDGVNFALFSEHATAVELLLYTSPSDTTPTQTITLQHRQHRAVNTWHVFVAGVAHGQCYAWRVHGPWDPRAGLCFDVRHELLDPYARLVVPRARDDAAEPAHGAARSGAFMSVVVDPTRFDWQGIEPPRTRPTERIIYEMHVAGFTHQAATTARPGTFDALIDKIPYLVALGVTSVELLPIFAFDPHVPDRRDPSTGDVLKDFWGYNPLGFFAPQAAYLGCDTTAEPAALADSVQALQRLVRALHAAKLEVILDVVFNHTGEQGLDGPTHALRGVDNTSYYLMKDGRYLDFTGCGNTVRCAHPVVRRMILDSLRYWTTHFHIDGYRFDLASVLSRDDEGHPVDDPALLWEIEGDPPLEHVTLIAEAWDAAGLYQVGRFPGERWCEWNGHFRDDVRRFWRGEPAMSGALAQRMSGSPDLYESEDRQPAQGVNFVTCHDGFTLADLFTYEKKLNLANGEGNRDGGETRTAWNCGHEGPSDDPAIVRLRRRMMKNLLTTLFIAQGTPMLLAGDELGRTQRGNNNPWCQDNAVSWLDWSLLETNAELHRFVHLLIAFRRAHHSLHRSRYLLGYDAPVGHDTAGYTRVRWHGQTPDHADWSAENRLLAYTLTTAADDVAIHVVLHAGDEPIEVTLPRRARGGRWLRAIDTARDGPDDILAPEHYAPLDERVVVDARAAVVVVGDEPLGPRRTRATQIMMRPTSGLDHP